MVTKIDPTKIVRSPESKTKLRSYSEEYKRNLIYLQDHYAELMENHRNHWIGLHKGKVMISEDDPERLLERLDKIRSKDVLIYYLADPESFMILQTQ